MFDETFYALGPKKSLLWGFDVVFRFLVISSRGFVHYVPKNQTATVNTTLPVGATAPRCDAGAGESVSDMGACGVVGGAESAHAM